MTRSYLCLKLYAAIQTPSQKETKHVMGRPELAFLHSRPVLCSKSHEWDPFPFERRRQGQLTRWSQRRQP